MAEVILNLNDNLIYLRGMYNKKLATYIIDATVTVTLVNESGVNVTGAVDLSMTYITDSDGDYVGLFKDTLSLTPKRIYVAKVTASGGADLQYYAEIDCEIMTRKS